MNQAEFMRQLRQELARAGQTDIDDILSDFTEHFANGIANGKSEVDIARELGDPTEIAAQYASEQPERKASGTRYAYRRNDMPDPVPGTGRQASANAGTYTHTGSTASGGSTAQAAQAGSYTNAGQNGYTAQAGQSGAQRQTTSDTIYVTKPDNRGWMIALLVLLNLFIVLPVFFSIVGILLSLWLGAGGIGIAAGALFVAAVVKAGFVSIIFVMFGLSLTALTILAFIGVYYLTKLFFLGTRSYIRWNRQLISGGAAA